MVSKDAVFDGKELGGVIRERTDRILDKFSKVAVAQVCNQKLLTALEDVKKYWRDLIRPSLASFSCEAVGANPEISEEAGLMFTLASSGFGLHDDILDNSRSKHLRMTILGLHGADVALLLGDLLIVKAWSIAHEMIRKNPNPLRVADILETYGNLSVEICEAEFMETQCRQKVNTKLVSYENILWREMAEIEACSRVGAMLGGGKPFEVEALAEFGRRLGLMSRLADEVEDCLNLKGDLLHRIKFESLPLPLLYAASRSRTAHSGIRNIIRKAQVTPLDAKALLKFCFDTEAFEYVHELAEKNKKTGTKKLQLLQPSDARMVLSTLMTKSYDRITSHCI